MSVHQIKQINLKAQINLISTRAECKNKLNFFN